MDLLDYLIKAMPKPTEAEQIEIDLLTERVADEWQAIKKRDSKIETLLYLRKWLSTEEVLTISKKMK